MPPEYRKALAGSGDQSFPELLAKALLSSESAGDNTKRVPKAKLYGTGHQYARLLEKAMNSGIITWSLIDHESSEQRILRDTTCCTLFAVKKIVRLTGSLPVPERRMTFFPSPRNLAYPTRQYTQVSSLQPQHCLLFIWTSQICFTTLSCPRTFQRSFRYRPSLSLIYLNVSSAN